MASAWPNPPPARYGVGGVEPAGPARAETKTGPPPLRDIAGSVTPTQRRSNRTGRIGSRGGALRSTALRVTFLNFVYFLIGFGGGCLRNCAQEEPGSLGTWGMPTLTIRGRIYGILTRRTFLGSMLATGAAGAAQSERPNVLSISVDDMNDWVGCLGGYPGVKTPNIDALARQGALFRDAHCTSPLCNPSRTALLTGKRPSTTGVYNNGQYWRPAHPDIVTLPMFFRENGYYVAGAGKIYHHVAGFNPPAGVRQAGRDRSQPVELLDIYPTLTEMCGLPERDDLEGLSLAPLLRDAKTKRRPAVIDYLPSNHAVVTEKWRYIRYGDGGEELYDRVRDPNEWKNLAPESRHAGLKRELAEWMPKTSAPPVPGRADYDFDFESYTWTRN